MRGVTPVVAVAVVLLLVTRTECFRFEPTPAGDDEGRDGVDMWERGWEG